MKKFLKILAILILILVIIAAIAVFVLFEKYEKSLKPVAEIENNKTINIEIKQGLGTSQIADLLEKSNVIQDAFMFKIYVKLNNVGNFQAGKYEFENGKEGVSEVIDKLVKGGVVNESVKITFVEGKTIVDYAEVIASKTNNTAEDVLELVKDEEYIDSLIQKYWFITDDVKNKDIYYALEGYILADTYTFENEDITVTEIFDSILGYMDKYLSQYKEEIEESEFNIHELLTLASIVELEGKTDEARQGIAGVFMNRLDSKMSLGSDVTTYYAFGIKIGESDLTSKQLNTQNPYNTRGPKMEGKLPVGAICSPSKSAINAVLNPTNTDAYFFVADKNGKIYFSKTNAEHQSIINKLKKDGMWFEY